MLDKFTYKNLRVERIGSGEEYKQTREKIRSETKHYPTGMLIVDIPSSEEENIDNYLNQIATNLWMILSFAHNHDVPICGWWYYKIENGKEIENGYRIGSIRMGKTGGGNCMNLYYGIDKFVQQAMPLIENDKFVENTNIKNAIGWYNESQNLSLIEANFTALWISLETLAHAYEKTNPGKPLLSKAEWKKIQERLKPFFDHIEVERSKSILYNLTSLREQKIMDKITLLLNDKKINLGQYTEEVKKYNEIRNTILHARPIDYSVKPNAIDYMSRLEKILEKIIFKMLDFYDNEMIHGAIKSEDLSVR